MKQPVVVSLLRWYLRSPGTRRRQGMSNATGADALAYGDSPSVLLRLQPSLPGTGTKQTN